MKLPKTKTPHLGSAIMINQDTGEKVVLGECPDLKYRIGPIRSERGKVPTTLSLNLAFTFWSRVKFRLFIWRTGFKSRRIARKWAK